MPTSVPASRLLAALGLLTVVLTCTGRAGQDPPNGNGNGNGQDRPDDPRPALTLGECIAVALDRQPALRAVRASQQATAAGQNALNNIGPLGQRLSPDLDVRKQQSARGAVAAAADVQKLHNEIVHDTTRLYYTAVYAKQQAVFAADVVAQVETLTEIARRLIKSPAPETKFTQTQLDVIEIGLGEAQTLHLEAVEGEKRAFAALREVMAVGEAEFAFRLADEELPGMKQDVPLAVEQVVDKALCLRPELALAAAGADAFRLEVFAQDRIRYRRTVPTLAMGSDIHARMVPPGSRDPGTDYRPEPVLPEMPPQLVGSKADRVTRALALSRRADAFYEKTRNLVILDAANAFYNFEQAAKVVQIRKRQATIARGLMERVQGQFADLTADKANLARLYTTAAQTQAQYVKAEFQYLLTLAALERVTAGGVRPSFPGR